MVLFGERKLLEGFRGCTFKMLNLFRSAPEWVHFIDIRESSICFLLQHPCKVGTQMRLRFPLSRPSPHDKLDVSVTVSACRHSRREGYIGVAEPNLPPAEQLEVADTLRKYCLVRAPEQLAEVRQTERSRVSLRVMGRHLPFYRAVALDLTPGGMKLHCQGMVQVGDVMELLMDTDVASVGEVQVKGRVVWALADPQAEDSAIRSCVAGIQLIPMQERKLAQVQAYLKAIAKRGDDERVSHRLAID